MQQRRRPLSVSAFLVALLLPLASLGCVFVGNLTVIGGHVVPVSCPASGQPQEEEPPSHAKHATAAAHHAVKHKRRHLLLSYRVVSLPALEIAAPSHARTPADAAPRSDLARLYSSLSRRGPPSA